MNTAPVIQFPKPQQEQGANMSDEQQGYTPVQNYIVDDDYVAKMTGNSLKCYHIICRFTDGFSRQNYGIDTVFLMKKTGIKSEETLSKSIRELEKLGLISVERAKGVTNKFTVTSKVPQKIRGSQHNNHPKKLGVVTPKYPQNFRVLLPIKIRGSQVVPPQKIRGGVPLKIWGTKKESFRKEEEVAKKTSKKSSAENSVSKPQLGFVTYHPEDQTRYTLQELTKKFSVQVDFHDIAKSHFPEHSTARIFDELRKMAQWSLSADFSKRTPQKWVTTWMNWMNRIPSDTEIQQDEARKNQAQTAPKAAVKPRHRYGQPAPQQNSIRDVGGIHE